MRNWKRVAMVVVTCAVVGSMSAVAQGPPIKSTTRLVQLSVVVTDKNGQPITGLKKEEFTVLDEGKPQEIAFFAAGAPATKGQTLLPSNVFTNRFDLKGQEPGAVTVILFDALNTPVQDQMYVRKQVLMFLQALKPGDHVAVFGLSGELVVLHDFTQDASALVEAVSKFTPKELAMFDASNAGSMDIKGMTDNPKDWARLGALGGQGLIVETAADTRAEMTARAFVAIAEHVAAVPGRKNLIWVSDGFPIDLGPNGMKPGESYIADLQQKAAKAMNRANMAVYPIYAGGLEVDGGRGPETSAAMAAESPAGGFFSRSATIAGLRILAAQTGGEAFYGSNDIREGMRRAFDDGRCAYAIAYYPSHGEWDSEYRKVKVQVKEAGVKLRYRTGYFAEPQRNSSEAQAMLDLQDAAASPLNATSLGMIVSGKRGEAGDRNIEVHVGLDPKQLALRHAEEHWNGGVTLYFVQKDAEGTTVAAESQKIGLSLEEKQYEYLSGAGLVLGRHVKIDSQAVELRVLVRDNNSQALGSVIVPVVAWLGSGKGVA